MNLQELAKQPLPIIITELTNARDENPDCPIIRRFLANYLLITGRFKEGFAEKEYRFNDPLASSPQIGNPLWAFVLPKVRSRYKTPTWRGDPNQTVLVFCEAGFGDFIQNIRYLPKIKANKVIVEVKPELYKLFKNSLNAEVVEATDKVASWVYSFTNLNYKPNLPSHDAVVSCESFHYLFDDELKNIPFVFPYLTPEKGCHAAKIVKEAKGPKIGIAWAGSHLEQFDESRSCQLKYFKKLNLPLFSLQKDKKPRRDLFENPGINLTNLDLADFNDTAEVVQELDLVIAVDTAVAHLAGALNKPVWLLLAKEHQDWRWQKTWYSSMKIFVQEEQGDWAGLFDKVFENLKNSGIIG